MNSKTIFVRFKLRHWVLTTSQKNPEISVESGKWNISFPENPFGNCRLSPEIVLLFHSERKRAPKFPYHLLNFPVSSLSLTLTGNWIANGKRHFIRLVCWFWKNPYRYSTVVPIGLFWQMVSTHWYITEKHNIIELIFSNGNGDAMCNT